MLSNWLWISRCGDYWQQAELRTDGAWRIMMMMMTEVKSLDRNRCRDSITQSCNNKHSVPSSLWHHNHVQTMKHTLTKVISWQKTALVRWSLMSACFNVGRHGSVWWLIGCPVRRLNGCQRDGGRCSRCFIRSRRYWTWPRRRRNCCKARRRKLPRNGYWQIISSSVH